MTEKSTLTILTDARALIAKPENWCQNTLSMDINGKHVGTFSPHAVRFCANGALLRACGRQIFDTTAWPALVAALPAEYAVSSCPAYFNNREPHHAVVALFDRAIATERAKTGEPDRRDAQVQSLISDALTAAVAEKDCVVA